MARREAGKPPSERPRKRRSRTAGANASSHAAARDLICGAALKLFQKGGAAAVSMREIAQVLGVSAMMPYTYFPSKDHLLIELRTRASHRLTDTLRAARLSSSDAMEGLEAMWRAYLRFADDEPEVYRLLYDPWALDSPAVDRSEAREAVTRQSGPWEELEAGVRALSDQIGLKQTVSTAAHVVWFGLHGAASLHLGGRLVHGKPFAEVAEDGLQCIMDAIARRPA